MTRSLIAIATLVLVASCAESPTKPTTSGGSSSGSEKTVTATPDETFECDDDLILEPHLPEECIPPEPVKPAEPPTPDPIVGTYRVFYHGIYFGGQVNILRVYESGLAGASNSMWKYWTWERDGDLYRFYRIHGDKDRGFVYRYQTVRGEPDLVSVSDKETGLKGFEAEALKVSNDAYHKFDFYKVQAPVCRRSEKRCDENGRPIEGWSCRNVGRALTDEGIYYEGLNMHASGPNYADTLEGCEAICENVVSYHLGSVGEGNCSDYQG